MRNELLPCPFCGGQADIKRHSSNGITIFCLDCRVSFVQKVIKLSLDWLEKEMIKKWNKRTGE